MGKFKLYSYSRLRVNLLLHNPEFKQTQGEATRKQRGKWRICCLPAFFSLFFNHAFFLSFPKHFFSSESHLFCRLQILPICTACHLKFCRLVLSKRTDLGFK